MAQIQTVLGNLNADDMGLTLPHEHITVDAATTYLKEPEDPEMKSLFHEPIKMQNLGIIRRNPNFSRDNFLLNDVNQLIDELTQFKKLGGETMVSLTCIGLNRDPLVLKKISQSTGVNIVTSTGWYIQPSHPEYVNKLGIDDLAEILVTDLTQGIENTNIKAGVIGEIGTSEPVPYHPDEEKTMRAACRANKQTGFGYTFHPSPSNSSAQVNIFIGDKLVDIIEEEDADINKFWMSHADQIAHTIDNLKSILDRNVTISFDMFGLEYYYDCEWIGLRNKTDAERIDMVVELCQQGYDKQLMLSQDVFSKLQTKKYGGYGFTHIIENIIPQLKIKGVTDKQIQNMLIQNPKRILAK